MAELYFRLVKAGLRTCDKNNTEVKLVPDEFLLDVLHLLTALGYDSNGNKIV